MKFVLIIILNFTLVINSFANAKQIAQTEIQKAEGLQKIYFEMTQNYDQDKLISKYGEKWIQDAKKFIDNNKDNEHFKSSENANSLMKSIQLLSNYLAVKNHFDKCLKDKENQKRQLGNRTLMVILKSDLDLHPCKPILNGHPDFKSFHSQNIDVMKKLITPAYENEIKKQVITNSLIALMRFDRKFSPTAFNGNNNQKNLEQLIDRVCKTQQNNHIYDQCALLDKSFKKDLEIKGRNEIPKLMSEKKYSTKDALEEINHNVIKLNQKMMNISSDIESGILFDSPKDFDQKNKEQFDQYIQEYLTMASSGAGVLMLTDQIKDDAGGIRSLTDDLIKDKKNFRYKIEPHQKIKKENIELSILEARKKILDQTDQLGSVGRSIYGTKNIQEGIDKMSAANPAAIGQILARDPSFAGLACDSFNRIHEEDKFDEKMDNAFFIGTAVLSGALILTGIGTVAGAYLLTGSVSAGIAAGTVGGSILATTAIVGTATEVASASYFGNRALDHYQEQLSMQRALLSNNTDSFAVKETEEQLRKFKEQKINFLLNLGASAGMFAASKIPSLISQGKIKLKELKAINQIYEHLNRSKSYQKFATLIEKDGDLISTKIDDFFIKLADSSENIRLAFLAKLQDNSLTPYKLRKIIEESLKKSKNC